MSATPALGHVDLLRRSAPYGLLVHALRTAAAVAATWPLLDRLSPLIHAHMFRAEPSAADAALVLQALIGGADLPWMLTCVGAYVVLAPLAVLAWLAAMRPAQAPNASAPPAAHHGLAPLVTALRLLPRAAALWFVTAAGAATLALPGLALVSAMRWLPEALQYAAAWSGLAWVVLATLYAFVAYDCARAALLQAPSLREAARRGLAALDLRLLRSRVMLLAAGLCVALAGEVAARLLPSLGLVLLVLPAQQCAALAHTLVGGLWLATTLRAVTRPLSIRPAPQAT